MTYWGRGTEQYLARCRELHAVAAARGNAEAMFELFALLCKGVGQTKDEAGARRWLIAAVAREHPRAL